MSVSDETYTRLNNERPIHHAPGNFKTLKRLKSKKTLIGGGGVDPKSPSVVITTDDKMAASSSTVPAPDPKQEERRMKKQYEFDTGTFNMLLNPRLLGREDTQVLLVVLLVSGFDFRNILDSFD